MARFDWCVHGRHTACHEEGTTSNGVLRCDCPCYEEQEDAA